ncbi:MAG: hypothetical protein GX804_10900 [Lentisphaerae bacterium]|nr:hypothetical protein [Lentisphaerota bacterium]
MDQRLVRDGYFERLDVYSLALYLFLLTVSNADGLSWYCEERLCRELGCELSLLRSAHSELCSAGLIAWKRPLYQVLGLEPLSEVASEAISRNIKPSGACRNAGPVSIGEVLRGMVATEGGAQ